VTSKEEQELAARKDHFPFSFDIGEFNLEVQQYIVCRFAPEGRDVYSLEVIYLTPAP